MVLAKTFGSPLDCKEIKPVSPKDNQSGIFIGRTDWSWSSNPLATWCKELTHCKRPWCWEDWRQEEKGTSEDEIVGWHQWLDGHEFEQALGVGAGQESLLCCSPWGHKESDITEGLNWMELRGFLNSSVDKESTCNAGYLGLPLGLGRPHGDGKGYPLQYSGLENFMESIIYMRLEQKPNGPKCEC